MRTKQKTLKRHYKAKILVERQSISVRSRYCKLILIQNGAKTTNDTTQALQLDLKASKCTSLNSQIVGSGTIPVATAENLATMHENVVREG